MSTWAIGDLQGCYRELQELLDRIDYDPLRDRLWFCGDLVNRGPASLDCLRFVMRCGEGAQTVLGNHDLHLLAVAAGVRRLKRQDTMAAVLEAPEREECLRWLRQQPLLVHDADSGFYMSHAGVYPAWDMDEAFALAAEVEAMLRGSDHETLLRVMYGEETVCWSAGLDGYERLRFIIDSFCRMRFLDHNGGLCLDCNAAPGKQPAGLVPWYAFPHRRSASLRLIFGHWSTVGLGTEKDFLRYAVYPLDTGCVWGRELTAMCLEDGRYCSVSSSRPRVEE